MGIGAIKIRFRCSVRIIETDEVAEPVITHKDPVQLAGETHICFLALVPTGTGERARQRLLAFDAKRLLAQMEPHGGIQ